MTTSKASNTTSLLNTQNLLTGVLVALFIAIINGAFNLKEANTLLNERVGVLTDKQKENKEELLKLKTEFYEYKLTQNAKISIVDDVKREVEKIREKQNSK